MLIACCSVQAGAIEVVSGSRCELFNCSISNAASPAGGAFRIADSGSSALVVGGTISNARATAEVRDCQVLAATLQSSSTLPTSPGWWVPRERPRKVEVRGRFH